MIHFLFLLNDKVNHEHLWWRWLYDVPVERYSAWAHCKDYNGCVRNGVGGIQKMKFVPTTPTWYCHDLVTAMRQLLKSALEAAPKTGPQKFVFVSDSTLPVKPFNEVASALLQDDDSDFCVFPKWQWAWANIDGHSVNMIKHHQWVVLSREHAELFVKDWVPVDHRAVWQVWLRDESWKGKERFVSPQHFHRKDAGCADEYAFMGTIYGAVEPKSGARKLDHFGGGWLATDGLKTHNTQGRCRTFTYWGDQEGPNFASVARQIRTDWGSQMSCYPRCHVHPASFGKLTMKSLQVLRHSEFLFVRKFPVGAQLPDYETIVIR